jgi:hypothetical protein
MGIPAPVLKGEVRKYKSVSTIYNAVLAREIMVRVNISFWARAKGGTDDLGNKWKPLAPSTHAYKPLSPMEKNTYSIGGKRVRGLLTPAQDKIWRTTFAIQYKRLLRKMGDEEAKEEAAKRAWEKVKSLGAETKIGLGRETDINIRTGALVAATYPGKVANNRYYPPKNQLISVKPRGGFRIRFLLPYVDAVDAVRPIIPEDITPWVVEAHDVAIIQAKIVYDRLILAEIRKKNQNGTTNLPTQKRTRRTENKRNRPGPQGGRDSDSSRS